jgi:hypothetical protein
MKARQTTAQKGQYSLAARTTFLLKSSARNKLKRMAKTNKRSWSKEAEYCIEDVYERTYGPEQREGGVA